MKILLFILFTTVFYAAKPGYIANSWSQESGKYLSSTDLRVSDSGTFKMGSISSSDTFAVELGTNNGASFESGALTKIRLFNSAGNNAAFYMYDALNNNDVKIQTSGTSFFNGGNVGIGTASPGYSGATGKALTVGTGTLNEVPGIEIYGNRTSSGDLGWLTFNNAASSEPNKLAVLFDAYRGTNDNSAGLALFTAKDGSIGSAKFVLDEDGNVGIGTQAPLAPLSVNSGASVTAGVDIKANGGIEAAFYDVVSDADLKKEVQPIEGALNKVAKLAAVSYKWKDAPQDFTTEQKAKYKSAYGKKMKSVEKQRSVTYTESETNPITGLVEKVEKTKLDTYTEQEEVEPDYNELAKVHGFKRVYGFEAQNVCASIPEACKEFDGVYKYNLESLFPVVVKALQEQQEQINDLKARVTALEK